MADKDKETTAQAFSFETVAVLVANILHNGGSLGMNDYKRMSALDGTRGASGFDHMFRKVKQRAKQLNDEAKDAGELTPVKKTKTAAGAGSAKKKDDGAASGKKRARKPKKDEEAAEDGDDDEGEESPAKKMKPEPEEDGEDDAPGEPNYEFSYL